MENFKIASAPTIERLEKLLNECFFSTSYKIIDMKVYNSKGLNDKIAISEKKGRFIAWQIVTKEPEKTTQKNN